MRHPRSLGEEERVLLEFYSKCTLRMSPQEFYSRWAVTHAQMAQICGCSLPTVDRWFAQGEGRREAEPLYQRRLAEMHVLWKHYYKLPPGFRRYKEFICSPVDQDDDLSP
jgi:hypothetical protein